MNPIPYLLCFTAGIVVNEFYHKRQLIAERNAYNKGYRQAKKETAVKNTVQYKTQPKYTTYEPTIVKEPEQPRTIKTIDESFMENLITNKRAVIKLR